MAKLTKPLNETEIRALSFLEVHSGEASMNVYGASGSKEDPRYFAMKLLKKDMIKPVNHDSGWGLTEQGYSELEEFYRRESDVKRLKTN
ncbi:MAG: hypothetical protein V1678_02330 [Candidatus Aenigmatarchaeota archaeon]